MTPGAAPSPPAAGLAAPEPGGAPAQRANRERDELPRWDVTERVVHWSTAVLLLSLIVTGAILYIPAFSTAVRHRSVVEQVHVVTGLALLGPILLGVLGPWRTRLVADLRRLDRWSPADWAFFRRRTESRLAAARERGKFNGGQKALAALLGGGMVLMVITGVVIRWSPPFPHWWANGATFFHELGFLAIVLAVLGHVAIALSKPDEMKSMLTGRIPRAWAAEKAPAWLAEVEAEEGGGGRPGPPSRARPRPPRSARPGAEARSGS